MVDEETVFDSGLFEGDIALTAEDIAEMNAFETVRQ